MGKHRSRKHSVLINSVIVIILLSLLLLSSSSSLSLLSMNPSYEEAVASSPVFELQELTNENRHWVQTYGNSDAHLKSNYTDIQAVNYISDGKNLNVTMWLASGFKNSSTSIPVYNDPFRKITYGMLIDADSNTETGYNGADYDFYIEVAGGKLSAYLYQLASTGGYNLLSSKTNLGLTDPNALQGSVSLHLDLGSIDYPSKYDLLFYTAESYKSNEVRQFTSWVNIPPPTLEMATSPNNIAIRQGQELLVPARIKSTTGFSNEVIKVTLAGNNNNNSSSKNNNYNYDTASGSNSSDLHIAVERNQPPLFKIGVPQQTPLGIYSVPLIVTVREPSIATLTKPISVNTRGGTVDPEFELSKKYPTEGYLTKPVNFTVTVIAPMTINEHFKDFWGTYGQFIGLFAGGFVGLFAKSIFDRRKKKQEDSV
jgi:hypothetical protein